MPSDLNPNVWKSYLYTLTGGAARGVWSFSVLSGYLYVLSNNSNWSVGLAEGIQGGAQALVAIFGGVLADSWRRDRVLALAGIVGLLAVGTTFLAVNMSYIAGEDTFNLDYISICVALAFWGSYQGLWNTGLETIFADSIPKQQRTKPTTIKYILNLISTVTGPVIAIFLFLGFGDKWNITELRTVMMVGAGLCAPPALLLFTFCDDDMVERSRRRRTVSRYRRLSAGENHRDGLDANHHQQQQQQHQQQQQQQQGRDAKSTRLPPVVVIDESINQFLDDGIESPPGPQLPTPSLWASPPVSPRDEAKSPTDNLPKDTLVLPPSVRANHVASMDSVHDAIDSSAALRREREMREHYARAAQHPDPMEQPGAARVPYITIVADILSGFGSGMTIKFFPLFFKNDLGLSPIKVNSIYVGLPIAMAIGSQGAQVLRRRIGRAQTCILYGYIGALALGAMSQLTKYENLEVWQVIVPIYILSSAQHCTRPLKKSILMDYVPKKTRARWNSIDSITRFGWSGSAVVGGFLVDRYSYSVTFLVTALMQFIAASLFFLLVPIVKIEPPRSAHKAAAEKHDHARPLLDESKNDPGLIPGLGPEAASASVSGHSRKGSTGSSGAHPQQQQQSQQQLRVVVDEPGESEGEPGNSQ